MVEFYLLTFPRFPLRKKEHKSYFGKNRTHDFRTSRCVLVHSGDKGSLLTHNPSLYLLFCEFPLLSRVPTCQVHRHLLNLTSAPTSRAFAGINSLLHCHSTDFMGKYVYRSLIIHPQVRDSPLNRFHGKVRISFFDYSPTGERFPFVFCTNK